MAHDLDVRDLTVEETLDLAIAIEDEACERYQEFVDQMVLHHTEEAAEFFRKMADLERGHAERLRRIRTVRCGTSAAAPAEHLRLFEVEAPEYSEVRAFMTPRRAADVALEAEQKAYDFYDRARQRVDDDDLTSLFEDLRSQEMHHQRIIERFKAKLPEERDVDPTDYVDPPRAQ